MVGQDNLCRQTRFCLHGSPATFIDPKPFPFPIQRMQARMHCLVIPLSSYHRIQCTLLCPTHPIGCHPLTFRAEPYSTPKILRLGKITPKIMYAPLVKGAEKMKMYLVCVLHFGELLVQTWFSIRRSARCRFSPTQLEWSYPYLALCGG